MQAVTATPHQTSQRGMQVLEQKGLLPLGHLFSRPEN